MYRALIAGDGAAIAYNDRILFEGIKLEVTMSRRVHFVSLPTAIKRERGVTVIHFEDKGQMERLTLRLREKEGVLLISVDAAAKNFYELYENETFVADDGIKILLKPAFDTSRMTTCNIERPWWLSPSFEHDFFALPANTQTLHAQLGDEHLHLQTLVGENFRADLTGGALCISAGVGGYDKLAGTVATLSMAGDPYAAVDATYKIGKELGAIRVALREERKFPELFESFGWCTWDAFYHDVTSAKIFEKLDELREKGIRIGWLLIDDGWSSYDGKKLTSFKEDRTKFPEGLGETIRRIKEEYGVPKVGVWHTFTGYWHGVQKDSELYREQKQNLVKTPSGWYVPSFEGDKAFRFWDAWHSYLEAQGVDFVKVDNQSSYVTKMDGFASGTASVRVIHEALERSVDLHFGGAIINCMGMNYENSLCRPHSALNRNSDDFFPKKENGFLNHIYQNAYNGISHSRIHHCDFDMWWSKHPSALQSSVLRAISGGPIYTSDEIGGSDATYIKPLVDENVRILRPDDTARPTFDCVYVDCAAAGVPLKLFNYSGDKLAVAAFGLTDGGSKGTLRLSDIPGAKGDYVAVDYFTGRRFLMTAESVIELSVEKDGVALYNFFPVKDGKATVGVGDCYMQCVIKTTETVSVSDLAE